MRIIKKTLIILITVIIILLLINLNTIIYILNILTDQLTLVLKSKDIDYIIKDNKTNKWIKDQLELIPQIMEFGDNLGFTKTKSYQKFISVSRNPLLYSLTASKKDSFEEYVWKWPIIGKLPYKSFIKKEDAKKEENMLKNKDYDTYITKTQAMSTLGILPDPLTSLMLNEIDKTELIDTIFHERTHQLFFRKNEVTFNENSAVLIASITTLDFIKNSFGEDSKEYKQQLNKINDRIIFSKFIDEFYLELSKLYTKNLSYQEKVEKREETFKNNIIKFQKIKPLLNESFKDFDKEEINNAHILSFYRYYAKLHKYYKVHQKLGNNTQKTIEFFSKTANSKQDTEFLIENFINKDI